MSFKQSLNTFNDQAMQVFKASPDAMTAFQNLKKASGKDGKLSAKTKELMALAIAISIRCEGCILFHVQSVIRLGATREEIAETVALTIEMSGGPGVVYGGKAIAAFDELKAG